MQHLLAVIIMILCCLCSSAQDEAGRYLEAAILLPSDSVYFKSVHTANARDWGYNAYNAYGNTVMDLNRWVSAASYYFNNRPRLIEFEGGYLSLTGCDSDRLDSLAYHFYHCKHLGNNRMDIGENGVALPPIL
ncbi:MAG: hypothetical protein NC111_06690 [Bacteroides sp.]|nr:hypothetical protein [Bacteroides sp.]MCM1413789.1 hypothetical protein [Bacteroides sp.]MCM1472192.1 hypothetical protein [Bacteroides sp.]